MILDAYILIILLICIYKIKFNKNDFNQDYLSKETSGMVKGLFALVVVLHHVSLQLSDLPAAFFYFTKAGAWAVAVFFFYTGYGVQYRWMNDENYDKTFLRKRMLSIVPLYLVMNVLMWIECFLLGEHYTISYVVSSFFNGNPFVYYSWYMIATIVFYGIYYLAMKLYKRDFKAICLFMLACGFIWVILCRNFLSGYGDWWYLRTFSLVLGLMWATYRDKIDTYLKRHYALKTIVLILITATSCRLQIVSARTGLYNLSDFFEFIQSISFPVMINALLFKFKPGNILLKFLGMISFEIYLSQGLMFKLLEHVHVYSRTIFAAVIMVGTIVIAYILHVSYKMIRAHYE